MAFTSEYSGCRIHEERVEPSTVVIMARKGNYGKDEKLRFVMVKLHRYLVEQEVNSFLLVARGCQMITFL